MSICVDEEKVLQDCRDDSAVKRALAALLEVMSSNPSNHMVACGLERAGLEQEGKGKRQSTA